MSYFKVDQLFDLTFSESLAYILPQSIKNMLVELESCLEITDAATETTTEKRDYKHSSDTRRNTNTSESSIKYRNRYDIDTPIFRNNNSNNNNNNTNASNKRDSKKHMQKESSAEWRSCSANSNRGVEDADAEWEIMRSFKVTKIESKTGIEKTVNDIRITLNKISASNYEKQRDVIMVLVNGYFNELSVEEVTETNTRRISKALFDIASTNKFYSEIYAKLYKELIETHTVFRYLLVELVEIFMELDNIPVYIDPDTDYDGFCAYSKACEIRKSTSTFLVNCLKLNVIDSHRVMDVICKFIQYVEDKRSLVGFSKCIEEIVENIYIIATMCKPELERIDKWTKFVIPTVNKIISEKSTSFSSMSNRAVFKLMDLIEKM
jgi:hypothetical protein